MPNDRSPATRVPEAPLVDIVRTLAPMVPPDLERRRRIIAAKWLGDLHKVVKQWNDEFINILTSYPGCKGSESPQEYRRFFERLETQRGYMLNRDESVKERLCRPIIKLGDQFPTDFSWLKDRNKSGYETIYRLVLTAYEKERMVIDMADDFIGSVYGWDISEIAQTHHFAEGYGDKFLNANIKHRATICSRIKEHERLSEDSVRELLRVSEQADLHLVPIEDSDVSASPGFTQPNKILAQLRTTPQSEHKALYTILAFGFGVVFLATVLVIAVFIPEPTSFQLRVFTTVMAVAAAGAATVMTGLINTQVNLGKQIAIGATGALAVFVIVYLVNPAVL
jgi:hypothetical protein